MPMRVLAHVDPQGSRVTARAAGGHEIAMDGDAPEGLGELPGPKETLLAALAGCTAMDVASILRKKRQRVDRYEIAVSGESATEHPRVFTAIRVEHRVSGAVGREALRRAIELSSTRYCPVSAMLAAAVRIEHHLRLTPEDGDVQEALVTVCGPGGERRVIDPPAPDHEAFRSS